MYQYIDKQMNRHRGMDMLLKMEGQSNSSVKSHPQFVINDTLCHINCFIPSIPKEIQRFFI